MSTAMPDSSGPTQPQFNSAKDARAHAKANKAYLKASRPWYKKKRFWLLGLLGLLLLLALTQQGNKPSGDSTNEGASTSATASQDKPLKVTAQKLMDELEANPLAAAEKYKGKRVEMSGTVDNIDAQGNYFGVAGTDEFSLTNPQVDINEDLRSQVAKFSKGQKVTVTGTITDVGEVMGYRIKADSIK